VTHGISKSASLAAIPARCCAVPFRLARPRFRSPVRSGRMAPVLPPRDDAAVTHIPP
jgi:hypothetical protein